MTQEKDQEKTCHTCKHLVEQNKGGLKMSTISKIARAAIRKARG